MGSAAADAVAGQRACELPCVHSTSTTATCAKLAGRCCYFGLLSHVCNTSLRYYSSGVGFSAASIYRGKRFLQTNGLIRRAKGGHRSIAHAMTHGNGPHHCLLPSSPHSWLCPRLLCRNPALESQSHRMARAQHTTRPIRRILAQPKRHSGRK